MLAIAPTLFIFDDAHSWCATISRWSYRTCNVVLGFASENFVSSAQSARQSFGPSRLSCLVVRRIQSNCLVRLYCRHQCFVASVAALGGIRFSGQSLGLEPLAIVVKGLLFPRIFCRWRLSWLECPTGFKYGAAHGGSLRHSDSPFFTQDRSPLSDGLSVEGAPSVAHMLKHETSVGLSGLVLLWAVIDRERRSQRYQRPFMQLVPSACCAMRVRQCRNACITAKARRHLPLFRQELSALPLGDVG